MWQLSRGCYGSFALFHSKPSSHEIFNAFSIYCFFLFLPFFSFGQWHDVHWFFGYDVVDPPPPLEGYYFGAMTVYFLEYPVVPEMSSSVPMDFADAAEAVFSDSTGQLVFYSNGCYINGAHHQPLPSCMELNPGDVYDTHCGQPLETPYDGYPGQHWGCFLPMPENDSLIYLFHRDQDYEAPYLPNFYYTLLNRHLNEGWGDCVEKNVPLLSEENLGFFTVTKHANGRDWWIVVPEKDENSYHLFLLTPQGVSNEGLVEQMPELPVNPYGFGVCSFSPDGGTLARYELRDAVYVYDFDRCDGSLSNPRVYDLPDTMYWGNDLEFSANNRFIYVTEAAHIYQIDLWEDDITKALDTVAVYNGTEMPFPVNFYTIIRGADGRIYISANNGVSAKTVINHPNKKGVACDVQQAGLLLQHYSGIGTLPFYPNYRLGPIDGSSCDTLGLDNLPLAWWRYEDSSLVVEFTDNSFYEPENWYWDFGDGYSSTEVNPVHEYEHGGVYEVCLTVSNANGSDTFCRNLRLQGSGTTGSSEALSGLSMSLYPNPLRGGEPVYLEFSTALPLSCVWKLYDADGRLLQERNLPLGAVRYKLPLTARLPSGLYFWALEDGKGQRLLYGKVVVL